MRYTLKQIAVFEAVASYESVSVAAKKLALTQSATSMALSQLEKLLGQPLFERNGKRMSLTPWGQWLRPRAKKLLFDAQQIELGFTGQQLISGELCLGASQTAAEHLVPSLISKIDTDFPELRVSVDVENTEHIIQGVLDHEYQLGVIEGRCDDSRVNQEIWCHDHLVIIAALNHPYAKYERISLAQLEQAKWVLREPGAGTRRIFDSAIHGLIDNLDVWREYEHVPILKSMVKNGAYLSCLPYLDVAKAIELKEIACLNVPELNMARTLSFIWRKDGGDNSLRDCIMSEAKWLAKRGLVSKP
ncbi:LysR family transcriptional regulator [Corallincola spongiicola]|uniref:LysR family transcriptional regulator n=1 Tax=Corallincola spongiicola TaxID=2520508 RepID=A0ABY1WN62_9GAMM|nr:LysR family transcriptional regulator [Corallincola spongiicola]TAA44990.1 LysR family transcriptional regulator [Corallincola spongiicola]